MKFDKLYNDPKSPAGYAGEQAFICKNLLENLQKLSN